MLNLIFLAVALVSNIGAGVFRIRVDARKDNPSHITERLIWYAFICLFVAIPLAPVSNISGEVGSIIMGFFSLVSLWLFLGNAGSAFQTLNRRRLRATQSL